MLVGTRVDSACPAAVALLSPAWNGVWEGAWEGVCGRVYGRVCGSACVGRVCVCGCVWEGVWEGVSGRVCVEGRVGGCVEGFV